MKIIVVAGVGFVLLAIGAVMLLGLVELADWIAEQTYALHR